MKKKKSPKILIGILCVVTIFIAAVIIGTFGALDWRRAAHYPPPLENPSVRGSITFVGRAGDHMGMAMWSGDNEGEMGHYYKTSIGTVRAPYFISTRDYDGIDPLSMRGIKGAEPVNGFLQFMRSLMDHGHTHSDLGISFPRFHLGEDVKGEDWVFKKGVETRYLRTEAPIYIRLKAEDMIALFVDTLIWMQDFNTASTFWDITVSGMTNAVIPTDISESSSSPVKDLTKAFLDQVGEFRVRIVLEKVGFSGTSFSGEGRTMGTFLDIHEARLEIVP